jgi:hypothetical protein
MVKLEVCPSCIHRFLRKLGYKMNGGSTIAMFCPLCHFIRFTDNPSALGTLRETGTLEDRRLIREEGDL